MGMTNSYVHVVKANQVQNVGMEECPNMVLDETCLNYEDFSLCLLGKVKEFASLTNLKVVLVGSWFSQIIQAHKDFVIDERVSGGLEINLAVSHLDGTVVFDSFKMVYRGMTCWVGAIEVPDWVPDFEEDGEEGFDVNDGSHENDMYGGVSKNLKDVEGESDKEEVPKTNFEEVPDKSIFEGNSVRKNDVHSEDPFEGDVPVEKVDNWSDENSVNEGKKDRKSEVPHKGGSILELIDDLINIMRTMGYDMTGCMKIMEEIIESQGVDEIHR
nr:nucleotide-binding alpha-beta plait domain-containing protein [Tanacetum cinerariifolium]